jgi:hypothetical protein
VDFSKSAALADPTLPGGGFETPPDDANAALGAALDSGTVPAVRGHSGPGDAGSRGGGSASASVSFQPGAKAVDGGRAPSRGKSPASDARQLGRKGRKGRKGREGREASGEGGGDSDSESASSGGGYAMSDTESDRHGAGGDDAARGDAREARRAAQRAKRDVSTPSANVNDALGPPLTSLGWIVNLRLPSCGVELNLAELAPSLLNPHLRGVDLSGNKKVAGDLIVVQHAKCDRLRELLLHGTSVTGNYRSVSREFCPALELCLLQGTLVIGNLDHLPGERGRPGQANPSG